MSDISRVLLHVARNQAGECFSGPYNPTAAERRFSRRGPQYEVYHVHCSKPRNTAAAASRFAASRSCSRSQSASFSVSPSAEAKTRALNFPSSCRGLRQYSLTFAISTTANSEFGSFIRVHLCSFVARNSSSLFPNHLHWIHPRRHARRIQGGQHRHAPHQRQRADQQLSWGMKLDGPAEALLVDYKYQ